MNKINHHSGYYLPDEALSVYCRARETVAVTILSLVLILPLLSLEQYLGILELHARVLKPVLQCPFLFQFTWQPVPMVCDSNTKEIRADITVNMLELKVQVTQSANLVPCVRVKSLKSFVNLARKKPKFVQLTKINHIYV